jgi:Integrase zinc binding domain
MLSHYRMIEVSTKELEEITTEEVHFPATIDRGKISQEPIPGLLQKIKSPEHYKLVEMEGTNIFHREGTIILCPDVFQEVLDWFHTNLNHPGQYFTYKIIYTKKITNKIEAQVKDYVSNCQVCKNSKI